MDRRQFTAGLGGVLASGAVGAAGLGQADAAAGVRAALERGAAAAVDRLGRTDGFLADPRVRIELPSSVQGAAKLLKGTGQGRQVDELVTSMNRAAEMAVPMSRDLLVSAARQVTVTDAIRIVRGGETSVTDYFAGRTRAPLAERFLPLVRKATAQVSLAAQYNALAGKAATLGLIRRDDADIDRYVTGKALDGLFFMIGEEEKAIRRDPVGSGSDLLRRVFG